MTSATIKVLLSHLLRIPFGIDCRLQTHPFGCSATPFYLYNLIIALFYSTVKDSRQFSYEYQIKQLHSKISLINCHTLYYFNFIMRITYVQYLISLRIFKEKRIHRWFYLCILLYINYLDYVAHQNTLRTYSEHLPTI